MTGVGLVFSATSGKVAALCFVLTSLIYLQWNELELCAKQRQEGSHCCTLELIGARYSIAENWTFTLNLLFGLVLIWRARRGRTICPHMRSVGVTLSHSPSGIRYWAPSFGTLPAAHQPLPQGRNRGMQCEQVSSPRKQPAGPSFLFISPVSEQQDQVNDASVLSVAPLDHTSSQTHPQNMLSQVHDLWCL